MLLAGVEQKNSVFKSIFYPESIHNALKCGGVALSYCPLIAFFLGRQDTALAHMRKLMQ